MKNKLKYFYSGVRGVLKHEGIMSLIKKGLMFLSHRFFVFEDYYIVVSNNMDIDKEVEADYLPKVEDHCWWMLTTNQEADELVADGFELGAYELNLRTLLDKDAIAFCNFAGKELAHFSVLADNPRGKKAVEPLPFSVDFEHGQIVVGRALTVPKFRRLHFRKYNGYLMRKYRWARGKVSTKYPIQVNNYPALAIAAQPPERQIVSKCRFIKILWFKYFKETEMNPTPPKEIIDRLAKQDT